MLKSGWIPKLPLLLEGLVPYRLYSHPPVLTANGHHQAKNIDEAERFTAWL